MPRGSESCRRRVWAAVPALLLAATGAGVAATPAGATSQGVRATPTFATPPGDEEVRAFFEDGPALLLPAAERTRLEAAPAAERAAFVASFLAVDPDPSTPGNELVAGLERRRRELAAAKLSPFDDRGRLLFLLGPPEERRKVECAESFRGVELWRWGVEPAARWAVFYRPAGGRHARVWRPTDSKRLLYTDEMEYLLEQFAELRRRISGKRPDLLFCKDAADIDRITGVSGLFGFERDRMKDADVDALFAPPGDLAAWARAAAATPAAAAPEPLAVDRIVVSFPQRRDQRLVARFRLELPADAAVVPVEMDGGRELRLALEGMIDRPDGVFEEFRTRFVLAPPAAGTPLALVFERALRPHERFVARLELRDEVGGRTAWLARGITVPAEPTAEVEPLPAHATLGQDLALARLVGRDTLVLLPPVDDVLFGLFRAEAIVAGERIKKVVFSLDGKAQLTRSQPPWSAELRLPTIPRETVVRVEGLDAEGKVIAADELLLNEPQGEPRIKLLSPPRGKRVSGTVHARAAVVVPEGRRVDNVEFRINDRVLATLTQPPWEATFELSPEGELTYLAVAATYDDGTVVEDVRVLGATDFLEEIEVDLVELYVTVTDRTGNPVDGLDAEDFEVLDNERPQRIEKFELVRDLPLTLGLVLDTSGSMRESLTEAKRAATDFLASVLTPKDRCFAVGFAERPGLLMPLTSDARALETAFRDLPAIGATSLHDALVYSLYQYRGVRGRKAMVLLSDGDDTASIVAWQDALRYAQASGVSIYTVGLGIGKGSLGIRSKLQDLAAETGGRTFFVDAAAELAGVYDQIERELRSQYLLAFSPDPQPREGERHGVAVKVRDRSLSARSARGYTP